jgi:hypothetical protein
MAELEIVALDEAGNEIEAPQAGSTYVAKRDVSVEGDITVTGTVDGRDVAADGALAASATQPSDNLSTLTNDIIASQVQAEAGTENTQMMTALRVAQAIAILAAGLQNKLDATTAPVNTNDGTEGYSVGSFWVDITNDESYRCVDNTTNVAVWVKTTLQTTDLATVALSGDSDDLIEGSTQLLLTPAERVILAGDERAYGVLNVNDASTAETLVDATPRQVTAWTIDGLNHNTTPDNTSDDITINLAGDYSVCVSISFSGTSSKTFRLEIYKNGSGTGFACKRKLGTGGDVGDVSFKGIIALAATDTIEVYQWSTDGGTALTISDAQLLVERIGT